MSRPPRPFSPAAAFRLGIAILLASAFSGSRLAAEATASSDRPPNIILILADDLGYECVGANGGESYKTPNLDKLAASGMRFEHGYAQPLCSPTRVQIMTGQNNVRNYITFGKIDGDSTTFATLLRSAGYATCMVGKWQLGKEPDLPRRLGFDELLLWQHTRPGIRPNPAKGVFDSRYANPKMELNGKELEYQNGEYGPDVINDHACRFIEKHKDVPFLLYYSDVLTHCPFVPTPDCEEWDPKSPGATTYKGDARFFGDMVSHMDKNVGKLIAKLEQLGLRENTLVLFLGDNGTDRPVVSNCKGRKIAGGKGLTTGAGMHVPLIASWPAKIKCGSVCNDLIDTTDFLPTLCGAARLKVPDAWSVDGRSFLPQLLGSAGQTREWIYSWYWATPGRGREAASECAFDHQYKLYRDGRFFDLEADPLEKTPWPLDKLAGAAASAAKKLKEALDQFKDARPARLQVLANKQTKSDENEK